MPEIPISKLKLKKPLRREVELLQETQTASLVDFISALTRDRDLINLHYVVVLLVGLLSVVD